MFRTCKLLILGMGLLIVVIAMAQTQHPREVLSVQGYKGQASVIRYDGHVFVDAQDLARITNGSLSFEKDRIVLTMPPPDPDAVADDAGSKRFSPAFKRAGIEAMASIREWGGTLLTTIQNGYPVGNTMAGNALTALQARAADKLALASASASNESDHRGLELLQNEFNTAQTWADAYVKARNSLSTANLTMAENPLNIDQEADRIVRCGQFLGQMLSDGSFQDDAVCH
ncbi:MAG TPA: hypothetical protein VMU05_17470 [Dongiaceae bacterium]|nr:hypothetical protein [Dongiaceae bacterium]